MHVIRARNVNDAYAAGMEYLSRHGVRESSRNGPVLVSPVPVTTSYAAPCERVLFDAQRDANPFFHLVEALWMLAGRQDANLPAQFAKNILNYANDGVLHGAYGYRWLNWWEAFDGSSDLDQLDAAVTLLRGDPTSRQAVITMWDPMADVVQPGTEHWRDRPCNTHLYLRVRDDPTVRGGEATHDPVLDITVCCRSNDIIWGAYGANAVHFSVLQEYLAAALGVGVGTYYQVSNNFHAYLSEFEKRWPPPPGSPDPYGPGDLVTVPLVTDPGCFLREVVCLLMAYETLGEGDRPGFDATIHRMVGEMSNRFLPDVAWPMVMAHSCHRAADPVGAHKWVPRVVAEDWQMAARWWIMRRQK